MAQTSNVFYNRNPTGKTHHSDCRKNQFIIALHVSNSGSLAAPNDEHVTECLLEYHRCGITSGKRISDLLWAEHKLKLRYVHCCCTFINRCPSPCHLSDTTVNRRRAALGLTASGATTRSLPDTVKRQLVLDQMMKDPTRQRGPNVVTQAIAVETGVHLTR